MMDRNRLVGRLGRGMRLLLVGTLLAVAGQVVLWPRVAHAAILVVDTTVDDVTLDDCQAWIPGDCSLRGAILKANNSSGADEIQFQSATTNGNPLVLTGAAGEDGNASGDLDIHHVGGDLTITGNGVGVTILDGGGIDRVLHICPPSGGACGISVTIEGVTIRNGSAASGGGVENHAPDLTIRDSSIGDYIAGNQASDSGGGIYNAGTVTVDGSTVSANDAPGGGGIINWGTLLVQNGSTVSGNTADYGGGIFSQGGTLTVDGSTVSANVAYNGGGIYNEGTLTVDGSTVSDNTATYGGGIDNLGTATVNGSTVSGNTADYGGGISNSGAGTLTVDDSTVSGNTASDYGGGIHNYNGTLLVQNDSTIGGAGAGNHADSYGGGIYNSGGTVTVDGSAVSANTATDGAGIYSVDSEYGEATLTVIGGSTIGAVGLWNEAAMYGGGIYNDGEATVDGSTVGMNRAYDSGGGIFNAGGTLTVQNDSTIGGYWNGNQATNDGGGICSSGGVVTVEASAVSHNTATTGGGIMSWDTAIVDGSTVSGNTAEYGGGIYNEDGTVTMEASTVSDNTADYGGGIHNSEGTVMVENVSTISGNTAEYNGGGIYNYWGTLTVDSSSVYANTAYYGGGIYNQGTLTVQNGSTVSDNTADWDGGGIYISLGTATVDGSTVSDNTAYQWGGGIYNGRGTLTVQSGSMVDGNTAYGDVGCGGGIFNWFFGTLTVQTGSTVSDNTALSGGGICNWVGTLTVDGSTIYANTAQDGGGIWNAGDLTVQNGSSIGAVGLWNEAAMYGGGIYNDGEATVDGSTVGMNRAYDSGGGIFNAGGTLTVQNDSTIGGFWNGNQATNDGGGICSSGGVVTVEASTVSDNTATYGGGIMSWDTATVDGSTVSDNTADWGGGIYNSGGTATVDASIVSDNTATNNGGGIYNNTGTLTVQNGSTIGGAGAGNHADGYGGGIYNRTEDPPTGFESTIVTGSRILHNTAGIDGGGVYDEWDLQWATSVLSSCIVGNSDTAHDSVTQQWATDNWWGAPAGPNTPGADTAGDYIDTDGWLTAPILGCAPDLQIDKTNDTGGSGTVGTTFHWTLTVTNNDIANAVFGAGQLILQDDLPPGPTYGTPVPGSFVNVTNWENIECGVTGNTLTCGKGSGEDVVIGALGGGFSVVLPVTPQSGAVLSNPAGICRVDPGGNVVENDEGNNDCPADVVTVVGPNPPEAAFESSSPDWLGQVTSFNNLTTGQGPMTYLWSFGDGSTSTEENPAHEYGSCGTFTVSLTASNAGGDDIASDTVEIYCPPEAAFESSSPDWLGQVTSFTNLTTGEGPMTYLWSFGDGSSSTQENPQHEYGACGSYSVSLTASNMAGDDIASDTVKIYCPPEAAFGSSSPDWLGQVTSFTNLTTGEGPMTYLWSFGDGSSSTQENPAHEYGSCGSFSVSLTASNMAGDDIASDTVEIYCPPEAAFESSSPDWLGQVTSFANQTEGQGPMTYLWSFGDGSSSTQENPTHEYGACGSYSVSLTASNGAGDDIAGDTVEIYCPPEAAFESSSPDWLGRVTSFTNLTTGEGPITYLWTFGDRTSSTEENPTHEYTWCGTFTVRLTASNGAGDDIASDTVEIYCPPEVAFESSSPDWLGQVTSFTNLTEGQGPMTYLWSFGDGASSTEENPAHEYGACGSYSVSLTASNWGGDDIASDTVEIYCPPEAAFESSSPDWLGEVTSFTNLTTGEGPITYLWSFGDGASSTEENPAHEYGACGSYSVSLTASNGGGDDIASDTVEIYCPPEAAFGSSSPDWLGQVTSFTNLTEGQGPMTYLWSFGDGGSSTQENPTHEYGSCGSFTVSLTASNIAGDDIASDTVEIYCLPEAAFESSSPDWLGQVTSFTNLTEGQGPMTYLWTFGDGSTSTQESPAHEYGACGSYSVSLTASNGGGDDIASDTVEIYCPPEAAFGSSSPDWLGQVTSFTNLTEGQGPMTYLWSFGDGSTSTVENPTHEYGSCGSFTVSLTASNMAGDDIASDTVEIYCLPEAAFESSSPDWLGQVTSFTNLTEGQGPMTYLWSFGDGSTSTEENPQHEYGEAGSYDVILTASNAAGSAESGATVIVYGAPTPDFDGAPRTGLAPLEVTFTNGTATFPAGDPTVSYLWEFGDGDTSILTNPTHNYEATGSYTVTLTASNAAGANTISFVDYVTVWEHAAPDFSASPTHGTAPLEVEFTNLSTGAYDTCLWEFGDGATSDDCDDPLHTYAVGTYTVRLTVSWVGGSATEIKASYITAIEPEYRIYLPFVVRNQ